MDHIMPSATESNAPAHVPAWRRLGLKLKSAQASPSTSTDPSIESPKRKRPEDTQDSTPLKKFKKASNIQVDLGQDPITPRLSRKKSVTFTPETKVDDGDSIKQLFNSWVAEQKSQDPSFEFKKSNLAFQTPEPPKFEEEIDNTLDDKERKLKRVKEPKKQKKQKTTPKPGKPAKITKSPAAPTRPFLQYLKQYCESKDTWKFNKNHQNHLIRSIFNIDSIPPDHAHFIYPYVRGLQGGVRTRLRNAAFAVKVKDQEDGAAGFPANMPEPEKRQREYDSAMKEYVATMMATHNTHAEMGYEEGILLGLSHDAMKERVAKRMRSERILHELGSTPDVGNTDKELLNVNEDDQKKFQMKDSCSQKVARKRKQRTVVADESSSSSEDSSDSDSESDSDDSPDESTAENGADDSSSSSSSSSSGSEGEADSDDSSDSSDDSDSDSN